jgi:hypothetical protein
MEQSITNQTLLSRVIAVSALDTVSGWLKGLSTLILADRAAYLVAGPIGIVLSTSRDEARLRFWNDWTGATSDLDTTGGQLARALRRFGVASDEAAYAEQRVVAGSPLIALTSADIGTLRAAHTIFARRTAVHVGLAHTDRAVTAAATELLMSGPQSREGSVVVADVISPLERLSEQRANRGAFIHIVGREIKTRSGDVIGSVIDALAEPDVHVDSALHGIRYLIVRRQSMLHMRRVDTAIPIELVEERAKAFVLTSDASVIDLAHAPRYSAAAPLSRLQEMRIRSFFGAPYYWQETPSSPSESDIHHP